MKKAISFILTCALCMGLSVPAFAVERGDVMGLTSDKEGAFHTEEVEYVERSVMNDYYYADTFKGWYPIAPGTVFTATNKGTENDGSFGIVYLNAYTRQPAGTTEQVVESGDEGGDETYVELDLGGKYLSWDSDYLVTRYFSANGNPVYPSAGDGLYWEHSFGGPTDGVVKLNPGESVSFTLPELEGDVIYQVYTATCYPVEDKMYYTWYVFKEEGSAAPTEPKNPAAPLFSDVPSDAYYADAVKWAVDKGVTAGTTATTFSPNNTCTKAQILTFLWRATGSPEPGIPNCFEDVDESAYYYKAAVWAYENGMIADRWFGGDTPCTRIETVTYLWTLAGQPAADSTVAFTDLPDDADSIQAVAWAVEKGVTAGTSATAFTPDATCTRGQIVTFLYRDMAQ